MKIPGPKKSTRTCWNYKHVSGDTKSQRSPNQQKKLFNDKLHSNLGAWESKSCDNRVPLDGSFWVQDSNLANIESKKKRDHWDDKKGQRIQIEKREESKCKVNLKINKKLRSGKRVSRQSNKEIQVIMKAYVGEDLMSNSRNSSNQNFLVSPDCQVLSLKTNLAQKNNRTKVI